MGFLGGEIGEGPVGSGTRSYPEGFYQMTGERVERYQPPTGPMGIAKQGLGSAAGDSGSGAISNRAQAGNCAPEEEHRRAEASARMEEHARAEKREMQAEERLLIQRCKQGDLEAFNELVARYQKLVFHVAYRLAGNYDDANDVAQEAFIRVFNSIGTFRGDATFTTWLYRIVTNVYLDERKKAKAHLHTSLEDYVELEENTVQRQVEDHSPTPDQVVQGTEREEILQRAIMSLPDYQRVMIVLYHTQGKSYEEIAEIVNLPIGTVKSRLNRARLALREKLQPWRELFNQ